MSAPPPAVEQLPTGTGSEAVPGFTIVGQGPIKQLNSNNKTGHGTFDVSAFVAAQNAPLVVVKYEADFCHQCKAIAPLFERLAAAGAPAIACFTVDVGENEDIGEASGIQNLPTFKFFTTKLSPTGELLCIDGLEGANAASLQQKFNKALEVVSSLTQRAQQTQASSNHQPSVQQQQRQPVQQAPPRQPATQQQYAPPQQGARMTTTQQLKKELVDIRTVLLATVQRVEHMYQMLQ